MGKADCDHDMQTVILANRLERLEAELNDLSYALQFNPTPVLDALVTSMEQALTQAEREMEVRGHA